MWKIVLLCLIGMTTPVVAQQVQLDGTTESIAVTTDNLNFSISGVPTGNNLFHSFHQFSIPQNGSATFIASPNIENIFSRITGNSISSFDGLLEVQGSNANFFLLNPNGIIFGPNASLNLTGSFLATTADRFMFNDANFFSATAVESKPLLTVNSLTGLLFGIEPGDIINRSIHPDSAGFPIGLSVQGNQTLALIGGNIFLEGGTLTAPGGLASFSTSGGDIELAGVSGNSLVTVLSDGANFNFGYDSVQELRDIELLSDALINTTGNVNGNISLRGRQVTVIDSSQLVAINLGDNAGGSITVHGAESVLIDNLSSINSFSVLDGSAGDINISTKFFNLDRESVIDANAQEFGNGNGGNITIRAQSINISNLSRVAAQTFGAGNAGNININTDLLALNTGGQILSSTRASGSGGQINITAQDFVQIQGNQVQPLLESISQSAILAVSESLSPDISATGIAGTITIHSPSLRLENGGLISTQADSGNGGNIDLNFDRFFILNNGELSATAGNNGSTGNGGNININAEFLIARSGQNNITANAFAGNGGNIDISTNALLGSQFLEIGASSRQGLDGVTSLTEELDLKDTIDPLPDNFATITQPQQGCPAPGGEANFRQSDLRFTLPEAQGLIARADNTIALVRNPALEQEKWLLELAQHYEAQNKFNEAKAVYESLLSSNNKSSKTYERLISLLFRMEPTQENLQIILDTHSKLKLTQLEDLLNCGDINLTSVYHMEQKADAIVTIIQLSDHFHTILSLPTINGYIHHYSDPIAYYQIDIPIEVIVTALQADNLFSIDVGDFILDPAAELYDSLIAPLKDQLPASGTLLFVLDGDLQNIPMSLLQNPEGTYLIEDYSIAQTPIAYLYHNEKTPTTVKGLFAGVSIETPSFDFIPYIGNMVPLESVTQELQIAATLPGKHTILHNEKFTWKRLFTEANRNSLVHIATHGQFSSIPHQTYLVAYDRLITLQDLHHLLSSRSNSQEPLELLVLSACETAQGDKNASLGLAGMAVQLGAQTTLASLWAVNDEITALWMEEFYRHWLVDGNPKSEAVRQAQLKLLNQYRDPRLWGAFIVSGNWL